MRQIRLNSNETTIECGLKPAWSLNGILPIRSSLHLFNYCNVILNFSKLGRELLVKFDLRLLNAFFCWLPSLLKVLFLHSRVLIKNMFKQVPSLLFHTVRAHTLYCNRIRQFHYLVGIRLSREITHIEMPKTAVPIRLRNVHYLISHIFVTGSVKNNCV